MSVVNGTRSQFDWLSGCGMEAETPHGDRSSAQHLAGPANVEHATEPVADFPKRRKPSRMERYLLAKEAGANMSNATQGITVDRFDLPSHPQPCPNALDVGPAV